MLDVSYRNARKRVADLATAPGDEQLRAPVPATPEWTVHELLALLVGVAADTACGRLDGAPGEQLTARHVAERRSGTVGELLADGYELMRAMFSRRSRRQIAAWNWTSAPEEHIIEQFGVIGPRDDDQPVPIA